MDAVDDLYTLPPAEFTAARDALAKQLKAEGDNDGAAEVKKLRRPTVGAWAVNSVARAQPELIDAVVEAGAALADAQSSVLGGGDRGALRSAMAARRDAVSAAARAAVALAGEAHRDAITATFDAAATDEDAAAAVRAGRLAKELDAPSGFGMFGDLPDLPEPAPEPEPEPEPEIDGAALRAAEEEVADAKAALDDAKDRLARAEEALAELQPD